MAIEVTVIEGNDPKWKEKIDGIFCDVCGIIRGECACAAAKHHPKCRFAAVLRCPVSIECEHGNDLCPICDPCECVMLQANDGVEAL